MLRQVWNARARNRGSGSGHGQIKVSVAVALLLPLGPQQRWLLPTAKAAWLYIRRLRTPPGDDPWHAAVKCLAAWASAGPIAGPMCLYGGNYATVANNEIEYAHRDLSLAIAGRQYKVDLWHHKTRSDWTNISMARFRLKILRNVKYVKKFTKNI